MPFLPIAVTRQSPATLRFIAALTRVCAWLLVLLGAATLVVRLSGLPWPGVPLAGAVPPSPLAASGLILLGGALWCRIWGKVPASIWLAAAVALLSLPTLVGTGGALGRLSMSPVTATMLVTASTGVLAGLAQSRPQIEKLILLLTGITLVALAGTVAFASAVGMLSGQMSHEPAAGSPLVLVSIGLLGICYLALVWWSGFQEFYPPAWLAPVIGGIGVLTVLTFWQALSRRESLQQLEMTREAARLEQRVLQREIAGVVTPILRTAEWLERVSDEFPLEYAFLTLLRDLPSVEALYHLRADGSVLVHSPRTRDPAPVVAEWRRWRSRITTHPDSVVMAPLDSAYHQVVAFIPVCPRACDGAVAAVIRATRLLRPTPRDSLHPFQVTISGPEGPLDASGNSGQFARGAVRLPVRAGAVEWWLTAAASPRLGDGDNLASAVLFLGLSVSLLLALTLHLGRSAWVSAQQQERARLLHGLERATDGVWEIQVPSGRTSRSVALWQGLGYPSEEIPEDIDTWSHLIHPEDRSGVDRALARHLRGDSEVYEAEYRVRSRQGQWHTLVERGRVVDRGPLGAPNRVVGISADVTESRATESALAASERRFRGVFDSSYQFQILLDSEGRSLEANAMALLLAGVTREALRGKEIWRSLWWAEDEEAGARLRGACRAAAAGIPQSWEEEVTTSGRGAAILELSLKPIPLGDDRAVQVLLEGRDVTERRRVENSLKEVHTLTTMGRIAARVAHEINNPLAGIQNAFLLIKDAVPADHPHHAYVGSIEREIERISAVTRRLYETYRPEKDATGKASLHLIVDDAIAFLGQVNRSAEVRITTDLTGVQGEIPIPTAILRQIVYSLVQNAIDASPPGGVISIAAEAHDNRLDLIVRDQGPGVPPDLRLQIFEPFFSTKGSDTATSGMGLGLALLQQTVRASGGAIAVGDAPGGGAEFVISLPFQDPDVETPA